MKVGSLRTNDNDDVRLDFCNFQLFTRLQLCCLLEFRFQSSNRIGLYNVK